MIYLWLFFTNIQQSLGGVSCIVFLCKYPCAFNHILVKTSVWNILSIQMDSGEVDCAFTLGYVLYFNMNDN